MYISNLFVLTWILRRRLLISKLLLLLTDVLNGASILMHVVGLWRRLLHVLRLLAASCCRETLRGSLLAWGMHLRRGSAWGLLEAAITVGYRLIEEIRRRRVL